MATIYRCDRCGCVMEKDGGVRVLVAYLNGMREEKPVSKDFCADCWAMAFKVVSEAA